MEATRTVV